MQLRTTLEILYTNVLDQAWGSPSKVRFQDLQMEARTLNVKAKIEFNLAINHSSSE